MRLAQLLKAYRAQRRHAEHCAESRSRGCDSPFPLMMEESLQGSRRAIDWQSELLSHDSDREINVLDAAQHVGYEVTTLEAFRVALVRYFVVSGAVNVIEYWTRQSLPGQTTEIMKVVTIAQLHAWSHPNRFKCGRLHQISHCAETSKPTTHR
jgi:hypothetical protein